MIYFNFSITNPYRKADFQNLLCISKRLTKNKACELEFLYNSQTFVECEFRLSTRTDHAGLDFEIGLFGYLIHFMFYDIRHWNDDQDEYEIYEGYY